MNGRARTSRPLEFVPDAKVPIGIETDKIRVIYLTKGKYALVDADNYGWLMKWWWCTQLSRAGNYYAMRLQIINGKKRQVRMHRVILGLTMDDGICIDHINGNGWDNRRENLRIATPMLNARNVVRKRTDNKSGYRGVYLYRNKNWDTHGKEIWKTQININGKRISVGYFNSPVLAAIAYDNAVIKHWGTGFPLNFPSEGL